MKWAPSPLLAQLSALAFFINVLPPALAQESSPPAPAESTNSVRQSKLFDPDDGWLDASGFLDTAYGFVPMATPITEPAIGYGAAAGLIFVDRKPPDGDGQPQHPTLAGVGGMATENGTWGAFAGWSASWMESRLKTLVGAAYGSINLDFFGVGRGPLNGRPLAYNVEALGGMLEARYRILRQPLYAGLRYTGAATDVSFNNGLLPPGVTSPELDATISGLTPLLIYDTRNNLFTPTKGLYIEAAGGLFSEALGSDFEFQQPSLYTIFYAPLAPTLTLGVKADAKLSFGEMPFYLRPSIALRGVQALRYVGEHAAETEAELRWQFARRFSVVGFAGVGTVWTDLDRFENQQTVVAGGGGFRYLLARKYGLHFGFDVAFGPDSPIFYLQFGNAWFRP